jgi:hypothetical protein
LDYIVCPIGINLRSIISWQVISIPLTLSNPKLGNPDVINRLDELINKAAGKTPGGG